jgi:hypothetical protein
MQSSVEPTARRSRSAVRQWRRNWCAMRHTTTDGVTPMSKRARKRRSRKGNAANHGRKPNA